MELVFVNLNFLFTHRLGYEIIAFRLYEVYSVEYFPTIGSISSGINLQLNKKGNRSYCRQTIILEFLTFMKLSVGHLLSWSSLYEHQNIFKF